MRTSENSLRANFVEIVKGEVQLPRISLPRTPVSNGRGRQATLPQRRNALTGPDPTAREYVGSQPASVYEAAKHSGQR
jgi:hypothetical protein